MGLNTIANKSLALEIAARALELTPRAQLEDRAGNSTESFTRSLGMLLSTLYPLINIGTNFEYQARDREVAAATALLHSQEAVEAEAEETRLALLVCNKV